MRSPYRDKSKSGGFDYQAGTFIRSQVVFCAALLLFLSVSGCASWSARGKLEKVAKDWSQTIRGSQVIPVYPLTEDLVPGDVFLVQTTIGEQQNIYRKRGFLPLDDHITRLRATDFTQMYFDGYWKDEFGYVPHARPKRDSAGPIGNDNTPAKLMEATAPRVAFPTYSFEASSSSGLALALPIQGIPVGLNFLHADRATGTVTIADARTFAADQATLYWALKDWMKSDPKARAMVRDTLKQTGRDHLFLRVVSRVYLTGAVVVSLQRSDSTSAGVQAGDAPKIELLKADGAVNENMAYALTALDAQANKLTGPLSVGGAIKFASASSSAVTLSESFDRLLAIGYLGFDVPVFAGAELGAPIPTFAHIEGQEIGEIQRVDVLSFRQQRFKLEEAALEALVRNEKTLVQSYKVMRDVVADLDATEFKDAEAKLAVVKATIGTPNEKSAIEEALGSFKAAAGAYVSVGGTSGPRYETYSAALASAYDKRDEQTQ